MCSKCKAMLELPLQEKMLQGSSNNYYGGGESREKEERLNLKSQKTVSDVVQATIWTIKTFFFFRAGL